MPVSRPRTARGASLFDSRDQLRFREFGGESLEAIAWFTLLGMAEVFVQNLLQSKKRVLFDIDFANASAAQAPKFQKY